MKVTTSTSKVPQPEESRASQVQLSLKTTQSANTNSYTYSNKNGVDGASIQQTSSSSSSSSSATTNIVSDDFVIKRENVLITDLLYKLHRRTTKLVDTHVICQDGYIPVHRCVLMACSKFLWEILVHEDPAELAAVCLPDYTVEQVLPLIYSFYTGCIIFNKSELTSTLEIINLLKADSYSFQPAQEKDKKCAPKMRHYLESKDSSNKQTQSQQQGNKNDNQHLQARLGSGATTQKKTSKSKNFPSTSSSSSVKPLEKENDPSKQQISPEETETEASNYSLLPSIYFVQNENPVCSANENSNNSPIQVDIEEVEDEEEIEEEQISHYEENSDEVEMELLTELTGAHLDIDADIEEVGNVSEAFEDDSNVFSPTTADLVNDVIIRNEGTASQSDDDERDPLELESLLVDEDFVEESDSLQGRTFEFETVAFDENGQHKQIAQIITEPLTTTIASSPPSSSINNNIVKTITKPQKTKKSLKEKRQERRNRTIELKRIETLRKQQVQEELQKQEEKRMMDKEEDRLQRKSSFSHRRRDESEGRFMKAQEQLSRKEEIRFSHELQEKLEQSLASHGRLTSPIITVDLESENGTENEDKSPIEENRRVLRGREKRSTPQVSEPAPSTRRQSYDRVQDFQRKKAAAERQKSEKEKEKRLQEEEEKRVQRSKPTDKQKKLEETVKFKTLSINIEKITIPRPEDEQRRQQAEKEKKLLIEAEEKEKERLAKAAEKEKESAEEKEKRHTSEREQKRQRVEELKRVKAEEQKKLKELQSKKMEEARRQKELEDEQKLKADEVEAHRKIAEEAQKLRGVLERQQQLLKKKEEETRLKQEEEEARLEAERKELERLAEEKRIEEEISLKVELSMKQSGLICPATTVSSSIPSLTSTLPITSLFDDSNSPSQESVTPTISELPPLVLGNIVLPAVKSHSANEQPRTPRKTTKFYEDLFQKKRRQAEEERRRKEREEEERRQQELKKNKEESESNAAKELIDILEGNDPMEVEGDQIPVAAQESIAQDSESSVSEPTETSEPLTEVPEVISIETVESSDSIKASESSASVEVPEPVEALKPIVQSEKTIEDQETIEKSPTCPSEATNSSEVPSISEDQLSPQNLEVTQEEAVETSLTVSAETQQLYEFVDEIPQETVEVTDADFFSMEMETDTINEVEVETEESGFNSGSVGRNSSEDGDDRASYEKVLEGCEQTLRAEQTTATPDPVLTESSLDEQIPRKESVVESSTGKDKSDNDDSESALSVRRKKKKNRKVREKHTQTKSPQSRVIPPDGVLSSTATAATTAAILTDGTTSSSTSSSSITWTTTQGNGTTLCIKRSGLEPLSMTSAAAALIRNPSRRYKVVSSSGQVYWVENPKVMLPRLSKRQFKSYTNRLVKYFAGRRGDTPPPTLTKATKLRSSSTSRKLKSLKKSSALSSKDPLSLSSAGKSILRSQSYDTDGRPPRLEPQLPSSSSSKQKRPASVPHSRNQYDRQSFSASPSFVPSFDATWYQQELKRCANCKKKYKVHTKATNCLLNHGFRRCWICLDLLPSHDASYEQHCAKFHTIDSQGDRVQCPICGKPLMMRGLPMHVTRKHLQPPPTVVQTPEMTQAQSNFQNQGDILRQLYRPQPVAYHPPHHHMQQQQLYGHDQFYHQQQPPFHTGVYPPPPPPPHLEQSYQNMPINQFPQPPEIIQPIKLDLKKIENSSRERFRLSESEDENGDSDNGTTTTRTSTPSDLDDIDNLNDSLSSPSGIQLPQPTSPIDLNATRSNDMHPQQLDYTIPKQSVITHGQHMSSKYGRAHSPISLATGSLYAFKETNVGVPIQLIPNPTTTYIDEELARRAYQYPVDDSTTPSQKVVEELDQQIERECSADQQLQQQLQQQQQSPDKNLPTTPSNAEIEEMALRAYQYPLDDSTPNQKSTELDQHQEHHQEHQELQQQQHHQSSPVEHEQQQQPEQQHQQQQVEQQQHHHHHHHHQPQYQDQFDKHPSEHMQHHVSHSQNSVRIPDREREHHMKRHNMHKVDNMIQPKKRILQYFGNEPPYPGHYDHHHRKLDHPHHSPYFLPPPPTHPPYYPFYPGIGGPSGRDNPRIASTSQGPPPAHFPPHSTHNPHLHHHHSDLMAKGSTSNQMRKYHDMNSPSLHHHGHSLVPSINLDSRFPLPPQDVTVDGGNLYCELRNVNSYNSPIPLSYNVSGNHNGPKAVPAPTAEYDANALPRPSIFDTPPLPILDEPDASEQQHHDLQPAHQQHHVIQQLWEQGSAGLPLRNPNETPAQTQSQLSLEYISRNNAPTEDSLQCNRCGENFFIRENLESHRCPQYISN